MAAELLKSLEDIVGNEHVLTDGDAHFDNDVGGQSWTNYPTRHMSGFNNDPKPTLAGKGGLAFPWKALAPILVAPALIMLSASS